MLGPILPNSYHHRNHAAMGQSLEIEQKTPKVTIEQALPKEMLMDIFACAILHQKDAKAGTLHSKDIYSIRLVCRAFRDSAWPAFAKSFNTKIFHPYKASLDNLKELAQCEAIRPYVTQLNISTVAARDWGAVAEYRSLINRERRSELIAMWQEEKERFERFYWQEENYFLGGFAKETLGTALKLLEKVREIVLVDGTFL